MNDTALQDHLTIVTLLPDYVLGSLDEATLRRVAQHIDVCAICRAESANAMNVLGTLAAVPPPPSWLRGTILRRAAALAPVARHVDAALPAVSASSPDKGAAMLRLLPPADRHHGAPFGHPLPRWAFVAASAAVVLVTGLFGWNYEQRNAAAPSDQISALIKDQAVAYPLDESALPIQAAGVLFAEPDGQEVYLVANGLPPLPQDQRYQVWLYRIDDQVLSAGQVAVGADGAVGQFLTTPDPFANYVGVALTAEPKAGSTGPTSEEVLGGSLAPVSELPVVPALINQ
jgi:anti-sigma-K factor RskA